MVVSTSSPHSPSGRTSPVWGRRDGLLADYGLPSAGEVFGPQLRCEPNNPPKDLQELADDRARRIVVWDESILFLAPRIIPGECACGRTHKRIDRLHGRTDDMLIIRGVNVFPSQIEDVMKTFPQVASWYQIELTRKNHLDVVTLKAEVNPDFDFDQISAIEQLQHDIQSRLKTALSVGIRVKLVEPKTIARSEGKAVRVIDKRKVYQ